MINLMSESRFRPLTIYLWRQHTNKDVFQSPIIENDEPEKQKRIFLMDYN